MTWVKLDENAPDDPTFLRLPRGVRLLHVEALAWSNRHGSGGLIPTGALVRLSDETNLADAAEALVAAGLWESVDDGWQLVWLQSDQPTVQEIEQARERNRVKQARHRRHVQGDHSECRIPYCKYLKANPVTNPDSNGHPNRTEPNRPEGKGSVPREGQGDTGQPAAPVALRSKEERVSDALTILSSVKSTDASKKAAYKQLETYGFETQDDAYTFLGLPGEVA